ncbi:MAG: universal stress protein [Bacteroidetes bacterium]|nr:universal stress protein [Bacteroidota bacterium]
MKKILVAVDFSDHTAITCEYAFEIAKVSKAEICLFHTYSDNVLTSGLSIPDALGVNPFVTPSYDLNAEQNATILLDNLKNDLIDKFKEAELPGIKVKSIITNNEFIPDIVKFCEDYHPSVVVVGTRGSGRSKNIFGDTATELINDLKFPVLAIPEIKQFLGIKNVMYATDLHSSDDLLIRKTFNFFDSFDVSLFCTHIVEKDHYLLANSKMFELITAYSKENKEDKFYCDVLEGEDKHEEIDKFIKLKNIDMITFLPHKANIFQRMFGKHFSKKYLFETNLPLLAIRL